MKRIALITLAILSFNTFAAIPKCSKDAQNQIDSILEHISNEQSSMKKIDLEFEINQISFNYKNCRKTPSYREIATITPEEIIIVEEKIEIAAQ